MERTPILGAFPVTRTPSGAVGVGPGTSVTDNVEGERTDRPSGMGSPFELNVTTLPPVIETAVTNARGGKGDESMLSCDAESGRSAAESLTVLVSRFVAP